MRKTGICTRGAATSQEEAGAPVRRWKEAKARATAAGSRVLTPAAVIAAMVRVRPSAARCCVSTSGTMVARRPKAASGMEAHLSGSGCGSEGGAGGQQRRQRDG